MVGSVVLLPILLAGRVFGWEQTVQFEDEESDEPQVEKVAFGSMVPFGPMLAVAGLAYFLGFSKYVDAYFADFAAFFLTGV